GRRGGGGRGEGGKGCGGGGGGGGERGGAGPAVTSVHEPVAIVQRSASRAAGAVAAHDAQFRRRRESIERAAVGNVGRPLSQRQQGEFAAEMFQQPSGPAARVEDRRVRAPRTGHHGSAGPARALAPRRAA